MKVTKYISLVFTASPNATAYISIPFKVKTIHIKSAAYDAGTNGTTNYIAIMSDLVMNNPIAILNQDTTYSSGSIQDIEHQMQNPLNVNGTYNFWLRNMNNTTGATSNGGASTDSVGLIIEFNGVDEIF